MTQSLFFHEARYKKPAVIFVLSLLCIGVILTAGCNETAQDLTITTFKISTNGTQEWNSSFVVHATPYGSRPGPIMQTRDGSLFFLTRVVRWNSTENETYVPVSVTKIDRDGHLDWEYEYPESDFINPDSVIDNGNDTFTIMSDSCAHIIVGLNGTYLAKEMRYDEPLCRNFTQPSLHGNVDNHVLDLLGIDRNSSYSVWTMPDGYVSATAGCDYNSIRRYANNIKIHLKKFNLGGNLTTEYALEKTFPFDVGVNAGIALIEPARDGELVVVGYNQW